MQEATDEITRIRFEMTAIRALIERWVKDQLKPK
jgi:hypothetical protein